MAGKMVAPASEASCMLRMWMRLNGVSRMQRTRGRFSLRQTSAARWMRFCARPLAMDARVPMEQGRMIIAPVG